MSFYRSRWQSSRVASRLHTAIPSGGRYFRRRYFRRRLPTLGKVKGTYLPAKGRDPTKFITASKRLRLRQVMSSQNQPTEAPRIKPLPHRIEVGLSTQRMLQPKCNTTQSEHPPTHHPG